MDCKEDVFQDFLSNCNDDLILNAQLTPGHEYRWVITSRTGSEYEGTSTADPYGTSLTILQTDLPAGLINSYGGVFSLKLYDTANDCQQISFKMARYYSEVWFDTRRGTLVKETLGCEF